MTKNKNLFNSAEALNDCLVKVLKEMRENCNLSQPELEAKLDVGKEYISKIERGKIKVTLGLLHKFSIVFDCTIADILTRAGNKNVE